MPFFCDGLSVAKGILTDEQQILFLGELMPVKIPSKLPAFDVLQKENIFTMDSTRADTQDIRPLRLAVLNLMPDKVSTETQILRLIANTPLQVEVVFLCTGSYKPTHTDERHLKAFYHTFEEVFVKNTKFDALIITGAPVEKLEFSEVSYWAELSRILAWAEHNVYSSLYICWAAQAALYYHYGINKKEMREKIFGLFPHKVLDKTNPLVRGFDDVFIAPHSRHTEIDAEKIANHQELDLLAVSDEAGLYLAAAKNLRRVFAFGHGEYDKETLHNEYTRDLERGLKTAMPKHYYVNDSVGSLPPITWRAHESLLISNWLNYCVYQATPFDIEAIK